MYLSIIYFGDSWFRFWIFHWNLDEMKEINQLRMIQTSKESIIKQRIVNVNNLSQIYIFKKYNLFWINKSKKISIARSLVFLFFLINLVQMYVPFLQSFEWVFNYKSSYIQPHTHLLYNGSIYKIRITHDNEHSLWQTFAILWQFF
jgi:hypothetical protein